MAPKSEHTAAFSVRLTEDQRELLTALAKHQGTTAAALARHYILDGMRRALDPDEISRRLEEEKKRLIRTAEEMRRSVGASALNDNESSSPNTPDTT